MRVINVDGKLQTTSSWGAEEDAAKKQRRTLAQLKADIRLILEGRPDQQEDSLPAQSLHPTQTSVCHKDRLVFSGSPCTPGGFDQHKDRLKRKDNTLSGSAAIKPPALWLRYDQIPNSERLGLWHHKGADGAIGPSSYLSGIAGLDPDRLFLRVERSVSIGKDYDLSLYTSPDLDGWFIHDPQPDSERPVHADLKILVRLRSGLVCSNLTNPSWWRLGHKLKREPHYMDIVAWKLQQD